MINGTTSTKTYTPSFVYNENILEYALFDEGRLLKDANGIYEYQYFLKDHLGNTRVTFSANDGLIKQQDHYYPFGMNFAGINNVAGLANQYKYNGKELQADLDLNWYDYGKRFYDPQAPHFLTIDPLAEKYPFQSPYAYAANNPVKFIDYMGMSPDWVETANKKIEWDENATSQATTKEGEKYLGKNVLVGTHNRDAGLNEPINTAKFELYLESNKEGPSATIMGNTVPADNKTAGTLAEGLYSAKFKGRDKYLRKGKEDLALIINGGLSVPTAPGSPKSSMTEIFFHSGNYGKASLFYTTPTGGIGAISEGCQTSGCGPGSRPLHNQFMNAVGTGFKGSYYLRSQPKLEIPKSQ